MNMTEWKSLLGVSVEMKIMNDFDEHLRIIFVAALPTPPFPMESSRSLYVRYFSSSQL